MGRAAVIVLAFLAAAGCKTPPPPHPAVSSGPLVFAHRGASGVEPEHTLHAYELAVDMGADAIEPDLVVTKDGVLIARHENEISKTTDVADKFPERKRVGFVDGVSAEGWYAEDFTLAEIKTLRARQRLAFRSHADDGRYPIPTFDEILDWLAAREKQTGRRIGVIPEIKHPSYFRAIGLPLEQRLADALRRHGRVGKDSFVVVQCFEPASLKRFKKLVSVPTLQLLGERDGRPFSEDPDSAPEFRDMETVIGLAAIKTYADWIAPPKETLLVDPGLLKRAHEAGLKVAAYTFRSDPEFLPHEYHGRPEHEYERFYALGVDAVFSDFPSAAVSARDRFTKH